jgi:hypothetical protein
VTPWLTLLREFGFPVVVALWFMLRQEKRTDRMIELQVHLMAAVRLLAKSIDGRQSVEPEKLPDGSTTPVRRSLSAKEGDAP